MNNEVNELLENNIEEDTSTLAYDDYYYYSKQLDTIINNQNTIIQNQTKSFDLINQGFTFLSFLCVIYFLYIFIKNMIRKWGYMKRYKYILILSFLFLFSIVFINPSYAACNDLQILDVPQDVKDYLSSVSSEYQDKENYKFFIHRYGYYWACLGINVKDISSDLKFFYSRDNGNGDFVINQTGSSAIPVVRYTLSYGLNYWERRTYDEPFGSGYWIDSDDNIDNGSTYFYSDFNIYTDASCSEIFYKGARESKDPYIANTADSLASGNFDYLLVFPGDLKNTEPFDLVIRKIETISTGKDLTYEKQRIVFRSILDVNSSFIHSVLVGVYYEFWFEIPIENLGITFKNDEKYIFSIEKDGKTIKDISVTIGGLSEDDILNNRFDTIKDAIESSNQKTQEAIEENTKTNKNIFERIGDILSYINPFSENFFGKKLVELILDGLKGLFVPEDGFFDTYFTDLKNWFSDRLGFLWTPFDIIIDILNKILNINFSEPIFHIPEIDEPFSGSKLISEYEYNLNSLLENNTFKNIHDIYFVCVDAVIIFALINLARKKIEEVFSNWLYN